MYYMNKKQKQVLDLVNKFGCIREDQLQVISRIYKIKNCLESLVVAKKIMEPINSIFTSIAARNKISKSMLNSLDVCMKLNKTDLPIEWCEIETFPFSLVFFRNGKVFDIANIKISNQTAIVEAINRSEAERIIAIIENKSQIKQINLSKQVMFAYVKNKEVSFIQE